MSDCSLLPAAGAQGFERAEGVQSLAPGVYWRCSVAIEGEARGTPPLGAKT
ncbi:hypothetical protein J2T57_001510 [Natronocella acetinitrilica]|uniref:Uncharacterized protein n=1 Tax=Natronocella acetinitrilica TaxID=414046 RepID=A0AAE3G3B5_9GAMM|nr:hypothetical protein [Natronocella acetinitrilica]MCP1674408.1 hypothetical protein [Natronocella acetinitrilica]